MPPGLSHLVGCHKGNTFLETKAPEGYTVSDELAKGRVITIDEETSAEGAQPTIIKTMSIKYFRKMDEKGKS